MVIRELKKMKKCEKLRQLMCVGKKWTVCVRERRRKHIKIKEEYLNVWVVVSVSANSQSLTVASIMDHFQRQPPIGINTSPLSCQLDVLTAEF